jgi:Ca2+-transporting ATPase
MADSERASLLERSAQEAARGLRVLAVAEAPMPASGWPKSPSGLAPRFLGLVTLADPIRPAVPEAIATCRRAGIRVIMITGDHLATARAIATQAGIDTGEILTGAQVASLGEARLEAAVKRVQVFARVRPEQKLALVNALRKAGEVVAMTGDGVNDAPALKAADIGVAMGKRGTDVAREAASLVLLDDDFTSIPGTVRLGRRIYDNIRNAMRFLVAVHVPLAGMALLALVAGWPLLLFPVHVVFLEFVIDPACTLTFEAEHASPRIMERAPRSPSEPLFSKGSLAVGAALGIGILAAVALVYAWALGHAMTEGQSRSIAFTTLVFGDLALMVANRSATLTLIESLGRANAASWWIIAGTLAALAVVTQAPWAAEAFRFEDVPARTLAAAAGAGVASVLWFDAWKLARRSFSRAGA